MLDARFLSLFTEPCAEANIVFVVPPPITQAMPMLTRTAGRFETHGAQHLEFQVEGRVKTLFLSKQILHCS